MGFDRLRIKSNARLFYKNNTGASICALLIYAGVSFGSVIVIDIVAAVLTGVSLASMTRPGGVSDIYDTFDLVRDILTLAAEIAILPLAMGLINWYRQSIYRKTSLTEVFAQYTGGRFWGGYRYNGAGGSVYMAVEPAVYHPRHNKSVQLFPGTVYKGGESEYPRFKSHRAEQDNDERT